MEKTAMRRDENLLKKAQAVFGEDLVVNAFVCTWSHEHSSVEEVTARLSFAAQACAAGPDTVSYAGLAVRPISNELSYDGMTLRLVFSNGRTVEFTNSEWASMATPGDEGYEA